MKWFRRAPAEPSGSEPAKLSRRWWQSTELRRGLMSLLLVYLSGLATWNIANSPHGDWLKHIFPHLAAGNTLDDSSINDAWAVIQQQYVIRSVGSDVGTTGAEQGLIDALKSKFNDRFSFLFTPTESQSFNSSLSGQRQGSIGISVEARCAHETICASGQQPTEVVIEDVLRNQPADQAGLHNGDVLYAVNGITLSSLASDPATEI